jgi:acetyltransferase
MVKFHGTLSEETVYFRYFGQQKLEKLVAHERLTRICFIDYDREMALVAVRQEPGMKEPEIIGVGRLVRGHGVPEAEFAVEISDRFQRQGLGTRLLQLLVDIGRQEGLERIVGYILPDNYSMLRIAKKAGFTVTFNHLETVNRAELKLW